MSSICTSLSPKPFGRTPVSRYGGANERRDVSRGRPPAGPPSRRPRPRHRFDRAVALGGERRRRIGIEGRAERVSREQEFGQVSAIERVPGPGRIDGLDPIAAAAEGAAPPSPRDSPGCRVSAPRYGRRRKDTGRRSGPGPRHRPGASRRRARESAISMLVMASWITARARAMGPELQADVRVVGQQHARGPRQGHGLEDGIGRAGRDRLADPGNVQDAGGLERLARQVLGPVPARGPSLRGGTRNCGRLRHATRNRARSVPKDRSSPTSRRHPRVATGRGGCGRNSSSPTAVAMPVEAPCRAAATMGVSTHRRRSRPCNGSRPSGGFNSTMGSPSAMMSGMFRSFPGGRRVVVAVCRRVPVFHAFDANHLSLTSPGGHLRLDHLVKSGEGRGMASITTDGVVGGRLAADDYLKNFADLTPPLTRHEAFVESERCYFCYDAPLRAGLPDVDRHPASSSGRSPRATISGLPRPFCRPISWGACARASARPSSSARRPAYASMRRASRCGSARCSATRPTKIMAASRDTGRHPFVRQPDSGKRVAVVGRRSGRPELRPSAGPAGPMP